MNKIFIVAKYTFLEIIKSKILMASIFIGISITLVSYFASELSYGASAKVSLDFGLGIMSLSSVGIALFLGATLIFDEVHSRTIYMILSRRISRASFLIGKLLGIAGVLFINITIIGFITLSYFYFSGGKIELIIGWSVFYIFLVSLIILNIVVLFSLISNVTLSVIFSLVLYFSGNIMYETSVLSFVQKNSLLKGVINTFGFLVPNLSLLNIKEFVLYNNSLPNSYLINGLIYSLTFIFGTWALSLAVFNKKNLD